MAKWINPLTGGAHSCLGAPPWTQSLLHHEVKWKQIPHCDKSNLLSYAQVMKTKHQLPSSMDIFGGRTISLCRWLPQTDASTWLQHDREGQTAPSSFAHPTPPHALCYFDYSIMATTRWNIILIGDQETPSITETKLEFESLVVLTLYSYSGRM